MNGAGGPLPQRRSGARAALARLALLARTLTSSAVRSAAPVGVPLYFGLGIAAAVLFAPNGLEAKTVTRAFQSSPALALGLFSAWIVLGLPIARAALDIPSTFFLRALPVPRWQFLAITGAHLSVVELPWVLLFARGEGLFGAAFAAAAAIGAHGSLIARETRAITLAAAAAALASVAAPLPMPARFAAALLGAVPALAAAWRRAPERAGKRFRIPLPKYPPAALAVSYLVAIRRSDPAVLGRALLFTALGGAVTPLIARGYSITSAPALGALSLGVAAGSVAISAAGIGSAILRAERRSRWLLDATGTGGGSRAGATAGAGATCGAALGLLHGALVSLNAANPSVPADTIGAGADVLAATGEPSASAALAAVALSARLIALSSLWGAALGALTAWNARLADAEGPREGGRALARFVFMTGAAIIAVAFLGEATLALAFAAALLVSVRSARSAADLPPPFCAHSHSRRLFE